VPFIFQKESARQQLRFGGTTQQQRTAHPHDITHTFFLVCSASFYASEEKRFIGVINYIKWFSFEKTLLFNSAHSLFVKGKVIVCVSSNPTNAESQLLFLKIPTFCGIGNKTELIAFSFSCGFYRLGYINNSKTKKERV